MSVTETSGEPAPLSTDEFVNGLWKQNPVFVQALGMCSVLAVSNTAINALAMGLATMTVLVLSNLAVSLLRNQIPREVRIVTYILIIASLVTIIDRLIQAISIDLHRALGAFISLIVVNCIILGRAEGFASTNGPWRSLCDALGMGLGFVLALFCLGAVRELVGSGSLFGIQLLGERYQGWTVMLLPPGGFFVLAGWLILFRFLGSRFAAPFSRRRGAT